MSFCRVGGYACLNEEAFPILVCHESYSQHHVEFVKLFTQVLSYEGNIVAKYDTHLRRRRTIYQASDCVHMGTSLHGHYGGKCCYYSTEVQRNNENSL